MKRLIILVFLAAGLGLHGSLHAVCVSNDVEFAVAVANSTIFRQTIELVQGTYHVDNTVFEADPQATFQNLVLLGGYTDNCASRNIDATNTTITSSAGNSVLFAYMVGDVTIEGIRFTGFYDSGVILTWNDSFNSVDDSVNVAIRRNNFAGPGDGIWLQWQVDSSHSLSARLVNNLVHGYVDASGNCSIDLAADAGDDATFTLINNTVVNNTADTAVCMRGGGTLSAYNNIFYGTENFAGTGPGIDLYSATKNIVLVDNVIGHHSYPTPTTAPVGTQTGDPQLQANFRPIEAPVSPVINTGENVAPGGLPGTDLDGGPRIVGSAVDRGAYESSINDAFIQTVRNTNNSGTDSLRAAINSVNGNGGGIVTFAIPGGCGPQVITLSSPLVISAPVIINAFDQSGASANNLDVGDNAVECVILESAGNGAQQALQVASAAGDGVQALVKGFGFSGFADAAIDFAGGAFHAIEGNHFGGSVGGHALQANGIDIRLGTAAHDVIIGGSDDAARNIIGDATGDGIEVDGGGSGQLLLGSNNDQIVGNLIGLGWSINGGAYTLRGNTARGVHMFGHDNTISANVIGDNGGDGVGLDGDGAVGNVVDSNLVGITDFGADVGNGAAGVRVLNDGHDNTIRLNTIQNNTQAGVRVVTGVHNKIRRNSIDANGGIGIDLAGAGVTDNDDDGAIQPAGYANRGQNFPVLVSTRGSGSHAGSVSGRLTTTAGDYTVDLYASPACDGSGNGQGAAWLGSATVTVPAPPAGDQSTEPFAIAFSVPAVQIADGSAITATATDASGDTSEFSGCTIYFGDRIFADGYE